MSDTTNDRRATPPPEPEVAATRRLALNEDWIATIVGLALLGLLLTGIVDPSVVP